MVSGFGGKLDVVVADCMIAGGEVSTHVLLAPGYAGTDKTLSACLDSGGVLGTGSKLSGRKPFSRMSLSAR